MKKFAVVLLGGLWALSAPLSAQAILGFNGGVNIANFGGADVEDTESHVGLNVGASILFSLGESLGLQIGAGYSEKGAEVTDIEPGVDGTFTLGYVEIPVLLRYGIPTSSAVGVHLFGGGAVAIQSKCELEGTDGSVTLTAECDEVGFDVTTTDFGLVGGAGVDIAVSDGIDVVVDLLYTLGLVSVDDSGEDSDVKNRVFTIRAGLAIPLG